MPSAGNPNTQLNKKQTLELNSGLPVSGVFTGPWHDTNEDGTIQVFITLLANQANASGGALLLQETEDTTFPSFRNVASNAVVANTVTRIGGVIRSRFWRVQYTNGGVAATSVIIYAESLNFIPPTDSINESGTTSFPNNEGVIVFTGNSTAALFGDGASNQSAALFGTSFGVQGGTQRVASFLFNGATWDRPRTPAVFKQGSFTAVGPTALWTPAAGKKFRLMKYLIDCSSNAVQAVAGIITVKLLDSAGDIAQNHQFFVPAAAGNATSTDAIPLMNLGNGILSAVANNVLNITLSTALTGGTFNILAMGTEE